MSKQTKFIFVTGGVVSSIGKGLCSASIGALCEARGLRVRHMKLDPYLNVDPGTMSPYQHGEVFVTDDGAETDLDIGHYERFLDENLDASANVTTGQVYSTVIAKAVSYTHLDVYKRQPWWPASSRSGHSPHSLRSCRRPCRTCTPRRCRSSSGRTGRGPARGC